jgi:hypothetical protein
MKDSVDKLYADYPLLFTKDTSFSLPEGWVDLVRGLCDVISHHLKYAYPKEISDQMYVSQTKEKFGALRCYMAHSDDFIDGVITIVEMQSGKICQDCGAKGSLRGHGWLRTLCDDCDVKRGTK